MTWKRITTRASRRLLSISAARGASTSGSQLAAWTNWSKRSGKNKQAPEDVNEAPFRVTQQATGEAAPQPPEGKNAAAVGVGRVGGRKGGKARAAKLTPAERSEIARNAARAR